MPVRVGVLSSAHMHCWGYANALKENSEAELAGIWDPDVDRAKTFSRHFETTAFASRQALLEASDAVVVTCENKLHAEYVEAAAQVGKHVLCEKPLVTSLEERDRMFASVDRAGVKLMTAFPCRYSPAFKRLQERVEKGEIGELAGICATNRGRCPFGWFVETDLSGGGAMIDHVVHIADLLRFLLKTAPKSVQAFAGNNMYSKGWEDTAMLTLDFGDGLFASLDSSWSRPKSYKTWGDVTMNVVGSKGVIELSLFSQTLDVYKEGTPSHNLAGFGSDLDAALVADFVACVKDNAPPPITKEEGWAATQVALAGYESARSGKAVDL
jgi:predicted dehydrogenase